MDNTSRRRRVVVAMSGGVDSSLAAALLHKQGYDVIGVTMQIWSPSLPGIEREGGCCSLSAVDDARRVADIIGIPYYVMNFHELFSKEVIDPFVDEYRKGRTPNPCITCNRKIKFEAFLSKALGLDAEYIATGHYARISYDDAKGRWILKRSADPSKDQTYALYQMTQDQLSRTLFPLGSMTKAEARELSREFGLPVADKPDSQEICFVPDNDYRGFLSQYAPDMVNPGDIKDTSGNRLGRHQGLGFYTVGQRRGLGSGLGRRLYVKALNTEENAVIVGEDKDLYGMALMADNVNLISTPEVEPGLQITAKIRYSAPEVPARLYPMDDGLFKVVFDQPVRAITPGQAVVFYKGECVLGGGTILKDVPALP